MRNHQRKNLVAVNAQWCASESTFRAGTVAPVAIAMRKVCAMKIDPVASGGPVRGGAS